jgi:hypothetical protein
VTAGGAFHCSLARSFAGVWGSRCHCVRNVACFYGVGEGVDWEMAGDSLGSLNSVIIL